MNRTRQTYALPVVALSVALCGLLSGFVWADEGPEQPPIPRNRPLSWYGSLVASKLPAFDSSMLTVPNGPDWMGGKTVHQVAVAMQDSDPSAIITSGSVVMGYDPPDGPRRILLDFGQGYIRYTNRNRSFQLSSPCSAVSSYFSQSALTSTLGALGLPTQEWDAISTNTVIERGVSYEGQDPAEVFCQVEAMATLARRAPNGYPVFDSWAREAVSNLNERARLLIDWPQFLMETNLIMRSWDEVANDMAEQIWMSERNTSGMGAEVELEVHLGYMKSQAGFVPAARAVFADIYDAYAGEVLYVPLAQNPSSGLIPQDSREEFTFRLHVDMTAGMALAQFFLPGPEMVRLAIFDVSGREVTVVTDAAYEAGWHQVEWNLRDREGQRVAPGVYFARLRAGEMAPARKILVLR